MIRETIKEALKQRGLKGVELAGQIGITPSSMSLFLSGKMNLGQDKLDAILSFLEIDLVIRNKQTYQTLMAVSEAVDISPELLADSVLLFALQPGNTDFVYCKKCGNPCLYTPLIHVKGEIDCSCKKCGYVFKEEF